MREAFARRRQLVVDLVRAIPGLKVNNPMGAFYVFPECKSFFGKTTPAGKLLPIQAT